MTIHQFDLIRQKPEDEFERPEFPEGFPDQIDVPAARYFDPAFFELEKAHIFAKAWQFTAHAEQLATPGDYVLLEGFPEPLFLIRGDDGVIRCFYNTCQHRGAKLIDEATGNKRLLVCPFHAWTYDRAGALRGFPEAKNYPRNAEKECLSLRPVRCETFGALIFINLDAGAPPLRETLGSVGDEISGLIGDDSRGVHFAASEIKWVDANWKLAGDANVETYHVPFLHKTTAAPGLDPMRTGQWLLPNGHSRMLIKFRPNAREAIGAVAQTFPPFPGLKDNPLPYEGVYSFHLFPNISVVMAGSQMFLIICAIPHGPKRHAYVVHYLASQPLGAGHDVTIDGLVRFNSKVLGEDLEMMPSMQASMESGALKQLKLQYQERRIRRYHEDIDLMIGAEQIAPDLRVPPLLADYVEAG